MTRVYLVLSSTDLITIWNILSYNIASFWSSRQKKKSRWKARKAMEIFPERIVCWRHRLVRVRGSGQRRQNWEVGRILEAGHNLPRDLLFTVGHGRHSCHFGRSPEVWLGSCGAFIAWPSSVTTFSFGHFWPRAFLRRRTDWMLFLMAKPWGWGLESGTQIIDRFWQHLRA